jgi:hypothetical protein
MLQNELAALRHSVQRCEEQERRLAPSLAEKEEALWESFRKAEIGAHLDELPQVQVISDHGPEFILSNDTYARMLAAQSGVAKANNLGRGSNSVASSNAMPFDFAHN